MHTTSPHGAHARPDTTTAAQDPLHGFEVMEARWVPTPVHLRAPSMMPSALGVGLGVGAACIALQVAVLVFGTGFLQGGLWALATGLPTALGHQGVYVRRAARLRAAERRAAAGLDLPSATARVLAAASPLPHPHGLDQAMIHMTWTATPEGMRCSYAWTRSPHAPLVPPGAPFYQRIAALKAQPIDLDSLPKQQRLLPWTESLKEEGRMLAEAGSSWAAGARFPALPSAHKHLQAFAHLTDALRWAAREKDRAP